MGSFGCPYRVYWGQQQTQRLRTYSVTLYASLLAPTVSLTHILLAGIPLSRERKAYIHIVQTSGYNGGKSGGAHVKIDDEINLMEGDRAFVTGPQLAEITLVNVGDRVAGILLLEVE